MFCSRRLLFGVIRQRSRSWENALLSRKNTRPVWGLAPERPPTTSPRPHNPATAIPTTSNRYDVNYTTKLFDSHNPATVSRDTTRRARRRLLEGVGGSARPEEKRTTVGSPTNEYQLDRYRASIQTTPATLCYYKTIQLTFPKTTIMNLRP